MTAPIIIAAILAFLLILALIHVGARIEISENGTNFEVLIGPAKLRISFEKEKKDKKEDKPKKSSKTESKTEKKGMDMKKLKPAVSEIFGILGRLFHHISIDSLIIRYTVSKSDPADTAFTYGYMNAAKNVFKPYISAFKNVKHCDIALCPDFTGENRTVYVFAQATLAVWEIVYIILKANLKVILEVVK